MKNKFPEVLVFDNKIFKDERGFFFEMWKSGDYYQRGDSDFFQDNISFSKRGVLRGIHFQENPFEQGKLVQVLAGKIRDVVVDLRKESPTFGQWDSIELEMDKQLFIPKGFGHAFLAIENSLVLYKCTNFYNKDKEKTIIWNDPTLRINWPDEKYLIISDKDKQGIKLKDL